MLKYITVPLSDNSVSLCHYPTGAASDNTTFINEKNLSEIIKWSMKENLSVQFIYPEGKAPVSLNSIIESVDNIKIVPVTAEDKDLLSCADVIVSDTFDMRTVFADKVYVVRTTLNRFMESEASVLRLVRDVKRLNVVFTDVPSFSERDIDKYGDILQRLGESIASDLANGRNLQFNLLTDRMMLTSMNNCNAGYESVAVSSDGKIYPCPAFLGNPRFECGDIMTGLTAPDRVLYERRCAPICRICDAFHCKRCVWLNHTLTHEVNTPGWQQCVMAHIERNAARQLLKKIRGTAPGYLQGVDIQEIDYMDPFTKLNVK